MFGVLREKRTPLNKLVFLNPQVLLFHNKIGEDGHITLSGVQFVAVFENRAVFPISLKMEEISSVVKERVNTDRKFHNYESTIAPLTQSRFRDCSVSVDNLSGLFEGSFKFKFYYGLKGREIYPIEENFIMTMFHDTKTGELQFEWVPISDDASGGAVVPR